MLNHLLGVLAVVAFVYSFKNKAYRYALIPVLLLVYELASDPDQYIFFNLSDANHIGLAEKGILILMTILLCMFARMGTEGKGRWLPVLFSVTACVLRFVRSFAFDWYTGRMTDPGADVMEVYRAFTSCCSIIDAVTRLAMILMLGSILWYLPLARTPKT